MLDPLARVGAEGLVRGVAVLAALDVGLGVALEPARLRLRARRAPPLLAALAVVATLVGRLGIERLAGRRAASRHASTRSSASSSSGVAATEVARHGKRKRAYEVPRWSAASGSARRQFGDDAVAGHTGSMNGAEIPGTDVLADGSTIPASETARCSSNDTATPSSPIGPRASCGRAAQPNAPIPCPGEHTNPGTGREGGARR